jgi:hypothetical protein
MRFRRWTLLFVLGLVFVFAPGACASKTSTPANPAPGPPTPAAGTRPAPPAHPAPGPPSPAAGSTSPANPAPGPPEVTPTRAPASR